MPNARNVESYSASLRQLVELGSGVIKHDDGTCTDSLIPPMERTIELPDARACRKTRFLIYSYLNACDRTKDVYLVAQAKAFRSNYMMRCRGTKLTLEVRGYDPISQAISKAVAEQQAKASGVDMSHDHPLSQDEVDALFKPK